MTEQSRFFTRVGNWFRRGSTETGDAPLESPAQRQTEIAEMGEEDSTTIHPAMSPLEMRGTFLRPWAKRDAAIEQLHNGVGALTELMTGIQNHLEKQSARQDELMGYLSHLPQALQQLPENSRAHSEALHTIAGHIERQQGQQTQLAQILDRISKSDAEKGRALSALEGHVQSLHDHEETISANMRNVSSSMETLGKHAQASAAVLQQLRDGQGARDGELERIFHRQGTRYTTLLSIAILLSLAAMLSVGVFGYLLYDTLRRGH